MNDLLEANFEKRFVGGATIHCDLRKSAHKSSITVLFGPSGCGKTTTLRCLAGLERPATGSIRFEQSVWFDAQRRLNRRPQEREVGFLFQDYALFPHLNVAQNIAFGLSGSPGENNARIRLMLTLLQIEGLESRLPRQLSGGQQQRVALARTLAIRPRLLLLDEPLAALDERTREEIRPELRRLLTSLQIPVLLVTHDRVEAMALGDEVVVLEHGKILQQGPIAEVFGRPADLATASIVGVESVLDGNIVSVDEGLAHISVGTLHLIAVAPKQPSSHVSICIRGEDVMLQSAGGNESSSPRNRLEAIVRGWQSEGPLVRVQLDCGVHLTALVTRPAWEELGLREGQRVLALIKAPAIHLIPRDA
ncbi:ATP-binding cassette domain-containing protein [soil metagenome]